MQPFTGDFVFPEMRLIYEDEKNLDILEMW